MEKPADDARHAELTTRLPSGSTSASDGKFQLQEKIGEGGMGEVWRARQSGPLKRSVAIKIIKRGMDTDAVMARFEAERQALALMDHPCIAKIFDAGSTPNGRPFFVMELVRGIPINDYCDKHQLSMPQRLQLFEKVCDGVQHAHQKAVIHRDLKPSNILVTEVDGSPLPKIIDFGVAKATAQPLTERTLFTELGQLIGTPEYMSPEQAGLTDEDVDTRTDIYSLGVILYNLLVGSLPFESEELRRHGYEGIREIIREKEPTRPSLKLTTLGDRTTQIAADRQTQAHRLRRQLRGDLDWIVMKALEKDRSRRYATPQQMAADIDRHLQNLPVVAGPPSAAYRARKFIRRHSTAVAVGGAAVVLLIAFSAVTMLQNQRIAREAKYGREISNFLTDLLVELDPLERGSTITLMQILDEGARKSRQELEDQPLVRSRIMLTIGSIYRNFAHYEEAVPLIQEAARLRGDELGRESLPYADSISQLASTERLLGHFDRAESLFAISLPIQERNLGRNDLGLAETIHGLAVLCRYQARYDECERYYERLLEIYRENLGESHPKVAKALSDLAVAYYYKGDLDAAEARTREALAIRESSLPANHASIGESYNNLGAMLRRRGQYEEARDLLTRALAIRSEALGPEHTDVAQTMTNLGAIHHELGEFPSAMEYQLQALAIYRASLGEDHTTVARVLSRVARNQMAMGELAASLETAQQSLAIHESSVGPEHPVVGDAYLLLAQVHAAAARMEEAGAAYRRALQIYEASGSMQTERAQTAREEYAQLESR